MAGANLTCSDASFTDVDCSGHGVCISPNATNNLTAATCVCDAGYTGRSDYINMMAYGSDCHINESTMKIIWIILLTASVLSIVTSIKRSEKSRKKKRKGKKGPSYTILFFLFVFLCAVCTFLLAIVKLAFGQDQLIGIDPLPTLLFTMSRITFYVMAFFMVRVILQMSLGNRMLKKSSGSLATAKKIFFYKLWVLDILQCLFVVLPLLFESGSSTVETLYMVLNVYSAFALIGTLFAVKAAEKSIGVAFSGTTDKKITKLKDALHGMVKDAAVAIIINVPLFVAFGFVKKAWKFWGYFIPAQYCLVMIVTVKLCKVISGGKKKKKVGPEGAVTETSSGGSSEGSTEEQSTTVSTN